jgi:hypothetical protein
MKILLAVFGDREEEIPMKKFMAHFNTISLRLRWIFMSPRAKYKYLWAKTKKVGDGGSAVRYAAAIVNR